MHGIGSTTDEWSVDLIAWHPSDPTDLEAEWTAPRSDQLTTFDIGAATSRGVIITTPCYGAFTLDTGVEYRHKTAENSLALRYLKNGTRAFVGGTHLQYSGIAPADGPYVAVTGFQVLFLRALFAGASPMDAFQQTKIRLGQEVQSLASAGAAEEAALTLKTLQQQVFYGRP